MNYIEIKLAPRGEGGNPSIRRAINSPIAQGSDEDLYHMASVEDWGASSTYPASSISITITDQDDTDVTTTVSPASPGPSVENDYELVWQIKNLTAGNWYRVKVQFVVNSRTGSFWYKIRGDE